MINLTNLAILTSIGLLTISCNSNKNKFIVTGNIQGAQDSILYLESIHLDGIMTLDSVKLNSSGQFILHGDTAINGPEFYALRIGKKRINFSVDSTETIQVKAVYQSMTKQYEISGNSCVNDIKNISLTQAAIQKQISNIENNDKLLPGDISDSIDKILFHFKKDLQKKYIYKNPASATAYFAVCQSITDLYGTFQLFNPYSNREDVKCYACVATSWNTFWPNSQRTKQILNMATKGMENTTPVQTKNVEIDATKIKETGLIDIVLPNIESQEIKLSDLKGKVVLLDFTIYNAPQSAKRTRILRSIYDKYHNKGFEIYQVSLDDDIHYWKQACEQLPWKCVHETDGTASKLYAISDLPTFFLINRDGDILKRSNDIQNLDAAILNIL